MFSGGSLFRRARHPVRVGLVLALGGLGAALLVALQTPAQAATGVGYDVSYPQCHKTLPSRGAFGVAAGSARTVAANRWWLDVETANSWTSNTALNIQALQGAADYLVSVGSPGVGFYSVPSAWASVTGSTSALSVYPTWLAGASSLS